jgi:DNA-binding MarR family transcriptional regulator
MRQSHERTIEGIRRLETRLTFKFTVLQRLLDRQLARILAPHGVSVTAYRVMAIIAAFGETSAAELGRMGGLDKGLVSRCVADLTAQGLLEVRADPQNARRKILGLTGAGRDHLAELELAVSARNDAIHALFEPAELERLHAYLDRITDHAARDLDERAEPAAAPAPAAK